MGSVQVSRISGSALRGVIRPLTSREVRGGLVTAITSVRPGWPARPFNAPARSRLSFVYGAFVAPLADAARAAPPGHRDRGGRGTALHRIGGVAAARAAGARRRGEAVRTAR